MLRPFHSVQAALLAGFGVFVLSTHTLSAQSVGKRFGSREPHTCPSRKAPTSGQMSSAQATQYFLCDKEQAGNESLYLAANVKIEVAKGRRFTPVSDSFSGVDTSAPVFDIRGSFDGYSCTFIGNVNGVAGKNCTHWPQPHATGECYRDTFGDWHCVLSDSSVMPGASDYHLPPPAN